VKFKKLFQNLAAADMRKFKQKKRWSFLVPAATILKTVPKVRDLEFRELQSRRRRPAPFFLE